MSPSFVTGGDDQARARLAQVFEYLRALHQHRNPAVRQVETYPWSLQLRELPDHAAIQRGWLAGADVDEEQEITGADDKDTADRFILRVDRPPTRAAPPVPEDLEGWVNLNRNDPYTEPSLRPLPPLPLARPDESPEEKARRETIQAARDGEHRQRGAVFARWLADAWRPWSHAEKPARETMKVFESLYALHAQLQREAERVEVVLGDGMLSWRTGTGGVFHPLLLQRLQLEFDPDVPRFTLVEADHPVEFYSEVGQAITAIDAEVLVACREELETAPVHPLGTDATDDYLRRVVNRFSPSEGQFVGEQPLIGETGAPRIGRDPYVFLRSRALGFGMAIERILEDIPQTEELPHPILGAVGIDTTHPPSEAENGHGEAEWEEPEDVLLSKPANPEQIRIARRLQGQWNVLVQGPPGTGKTHTIANLLGHLLAHGKSVLVTSHTTKALRVLRHQVVEALRPLCVSVLDSDGDSRQELEESVRAIVERLGTSDEHALRSEGQRLATERSQLLAELRTLRRNLADARNDEYRSVVVDGESHAPSDAARKVAREADEHGWIPGKVALGEQLPLSPDELRALYATNESLSSADEKELGFELPHPDVLLPPVVFSELLAFLAELASHDLAVRAELWSASASTDLNGLESLLARLRDASHALDDLQEWELEVFAAGLSPQKEDDALWEDLTAEIQALRHQALKAQRAIVDYGPVLATDEQVDVQIRVFGEIQEHLKSGGSLGLGTLLVRPTWKRVLAKCSVDSGNNGKTIRTAEHVAALKVKAELEAARARLRGRWDRLLSPFGAPDASRLGEDLERTAERFIPRIQRALRWYENEWVPLEKQLREVGFAWDRLLGEQPPRLDRHGDLLRLKEAVHEGLPPIIASRVGRLQLEEGQRKLEALLALLGHYGSAEVVAELTRSVQARDVEGYDTAYRRLRDLHQRSALLRQRRELLSRLHPVAPDWALAIEGRHEPHSLGVCPGDARAAWLWRELHDELDRRGAVSLEDLQAKISTASQRLRTVTARLIDRTAWESQVRRTTRQQQQALMGYRGVVRKIGKGTGIRAPALKLEAQRLMSECRDAVPVWIMPLSRVADTFDPRRMRFDVVIIDEASQCDMMGLIAMYLGRKVVVVGDDEQVSPDAVGQKVEEVDRLISVHLRGIPNAALYDGQRSIYDLANESFGSPIRLVEHFRCVPEIVQFSNYLSYGGTIKPLRDASGLKIKPHTVAHHIPSAVLDDRSRTNPVEAETIASLVASCMEQAEYADATIGVISMVGDPQAFLIDQHLRGKLSPQQYTHHRVLCGNASQFQGDERDVIFLSLVSTPGDRVLRLVNEGAYGSTKKRYNVAASRARDQLWVVHSMDPTVDLKSDDLRLRLIKHAQDPNAIEAKIERAATLAESPFEIEVQKHLITRGFRVIPQWRVGHYRIDIVVEGCGKRLAVECDGDRFHPPEQLEADLGRQAVLERLGWQFARIRGTQFFRCPDAAMDPVLRRLAALGIQPTGGEETDTSDTHANAEAELLERVRRRAAELRREWRGETTESDGQEAASREDRPVESAPVRDQGPAETRVSQPTTSPPPVISAAPPPPPVPPAAPVVPIRVEPVRAPQAGPDAPLVPALEPYVCATSPFEKGAEPDFEKAEKLEVARALEHVVQIEGPVHEFLAYRRAAGFFGVERLGSRIQEVMTVVRRALINAGRVTSRNGFLSTSAQASSPIRVRGPAVDGYVRSIAEIPAEEIVACAAMCQELYRTTDSVALTIAVARAFGFRRTGHNVHERISAILRAHPEILGDLADPGAP